MLPLFQDKFIFVEATSSHFFRVTTLTQQVLFWGSCFFRTAAVFSFFRTVAFSQELFFQNSFIFEAKILQSSHFLRIESSLRQLLFRTAIFFGGTVYDKDIYKRATFSKQVTLHKINLFRKATFWKKLIFQEINFCITYIFWRAFFLEQLFLQKTLPSIAATFSEELLFYNILFQKKFLSLVTLLIYSLVIK